MKSRLIILIFIGIVLVSGCIQQETQPRTQTPTTPFGTSGTPGQIQITEKMPVKEAFENLIAENNFSSRIQESFKVSPDGKRVAYIANAGDRQFVVVDGKEERQYDGIGEGTLIFSPDSRRVAYVAIAGNKQFVVVDGKEEKQYDAIGIPIFSPDSKRMAYMVQVDNRQFVVVDGNEEKQYDGIGERTLVFSPDSKKVAYAAQAADKWFVVIDGKEGKQYDSILGEGITFDSPDSLHYLASSGAEIYLVEERIK